MALRCVDRVAVEDSECEAGIGGRAVGVGGGLVSINSYELSAMSCQLGDEGGEEGGELAFDAAADLHDVFVVDGLGCLLA